MDRIDFVVCLLMSPLQMCQVFPCRYFFQTTNKDCNELRHNYATLLGRELTQTVPYFKSFADCIPKHNEHKYSKEMATKSTVVRPGHYYYHCYLFPFL